MTNAHALYIPYRGYHIDAGLGCYADVLARISIMEEALIGVLVDVSGSMRSAYELDRSTDASVERTHAIITTLVDIVKREVVRHGRRESIFTCAFGLDRGECGNACTGTCDLVPLFNSPRDGHQALVKLALEYRAPQTEWWIRKHLSQLEAQILYIGLRQKPSFIPELIKLIPSEFQTSMVDKAEGVNSFLAKFGVRNYVKEGADAAAAKSEAFKLAHKIIDGIWQDLPQPRAVQEVSKMLDELLKSPSASSTSHDQIRKFLKQIEPFIFGRTPMCKALGDARAVFQNRNIKKKVLFILSDGDSTDGDPRPICEELHRSNITIVTCFLTSDEIGNPRQLLYEPDPNWRSGDGRSVLFEMSSTMPNTHTPISYLTDANWTLPASGESRLFVQANSLDVVDEFCTIVVSQMTEPCDALVDILEKVDLATYINQNNAAFKLKDMQQPGTCYAAAIATVIHLATHRIVGREGVIPTYKDVYECVIDKYGREGAYTVQVITKVCPDYRLTFQASRRDRCKAGHQPEATCHGHILLV